MSQIHQIAFDLCVEFITAINQHDFIVLNQKFDLSEAVWYEIQTGVLAIYC